MFQKLKQNKKGIETGLVDFYATIVIALIIIIFFFVLHVQGTKMIYEVQGETFPLDAATIGNTYLRQTISSEGKEYTVAELLVLVQTDDSYEKNLEESTDSFIKTIQEKVKKQVGIRVYSKDENVANYGAFTAPGDVVSGPLANIPSTTTVSSRFTLPTADPSAPVTVIILIQCYEDEEC